MAIWQPVQCRCKVRRPITRRGKGCAKIFTDEKGIGSGAVVRGQFVPKLITEGHQRTQRRAVNTILLPLMFCIVWHNPMRIRTIRIVGFYYHKLRANRTTQLTPQPIVIAIHINHQHIRLGLPRNQIHYIFSGNKCLYRFNIERFPN